MEASEIQRVSECSEVLINPARLAALDETQLMGTLREEAFDRLTRLAAKILDAPLTIVSFVGKDEQFFKSFHGLPEPWASNPVIPIGNSVCRFTLSGEPLLIENANNVSYLKGNPAIPALNLVAYMGVPLLTSKGQNLGAFCVVDYKVRKWKLEELEILKELTQSVMVEIENRVISHRLQKTVNDLTLERDLREKFVITLTHDLRNPLSAAKLSANMIQRKPAEAAKYVERVVTNLTRVDSMIQNLLDMNQISSGEAFPLVLEKCDLNEVVEKSLKEMQALHGERFSFESTGSVVGFWNADGLQRVCDNLISNAVKYGDAESPIQIQVRKENDAAFLSVHNFGNPIASADQQKLFEPYHRTEEAKKSGQAGWGIGLALVRGMITAMKGSVSVESSQDLGTTFRIRLPHET
jgi:signal transduction histidine kinase